MPQLLNKQPDKTPVTIFNPALEAFSFTYDGGRIKHTLAGYDFGTYPKWLADKMANQLADWYMAKYGITLNYELDKKALLERIYV